MTRVLAFTLLTVLLVSRAGLAQTPQPAASAPAAAAATPAQPAPAPAAPGATPGAPAAQGATEEKKADALEPQGYTYNPEGRRDPFVSLLRRGAESTTSGPRLAGLAGLGTAEVSLRGTLISQGAYVGIVRGVDSKTYIVHAGDKLSDGSIRTITADAMVIVQQVNDPLSLEKVREVRKLLRQTEEGK